MRLWGLLAWLAWLFIHVLFLIGFRNRVLVLIEWAWAYLTFQRGARLITGPPAEDITTDTGERARLRASDDGVRLSEQSRAS